MYTLVAASPLLLSTLFMLSLLYFLLGIAALIQISGTLHSRCVFMDGLPNPALANRPCGAAGRPCDLGQACVDIGVAPSYNLAGFDDLPTSMLAIFQIMTLEGWSDLLHTTSAGAGPLFVTPFVLFTVVFVGFLAIAVFTAIISAKYTQLSINWSNELRQLAGSDEQGPLGSGLPSWLPLWLRAFYVWCAADYGYQRPLRVVIAHPLFETFLILTIAVNSVCMTLEFPGQPAWLTSLLSVLNIVFVAVYVAELVLKLAGFGVVNFLRKREEVFNGAVTLVSLLDLFLAAVGASIFRTIRLLRILRSARLFLVHRSFRKLTIVILNGTETLGNWVIVTTVAIFIFTVLGYHSFGPSTDLDALRALGGPLSPHTFTTFLDSFFAVFDMFTGYRWFAVMYDVCAQQQAAAAAYFVLWMLVVLVLRAVLSAILIESFSSQSSNRSGDGGDEKEYVTKLQHARWRQLAYVETLEQLGDEQAVFISERINRRRQRKVGRPPEGGEGGAERESERGVHPSAPLVPSFLQHRPQNMTVVASGGKFTAMRAFERGRSRGCRTGKGGGLLPPHLFCLNSFASGRRHLGEEAKYTAAEAGRGRGEGEGGGVVAGGLILRRERGEDGSPTPCPPPPPPPPTHPPI